MSVTHRKKITSTQNPLVKHLVKLRKDKEYRYSKRLLFVEGEKLLKEVKLPLKRVILREDKTGFLEAEEIQYVSKSVFEKISGVRSSEGVAGEIAMPKEESLAGKELILALDGINDPGNLGTLIRTALALGVGGIFLFPSCVDPYNEKALRAAKGATFKLPLQTKRLDTEGFHVYVASLKGAPATSLTFKKPAILILGNEAHGVSKKREEMGLLVTIPMSGDIESLNVAVSGAILIHAMAFPKERVGTP